LNLRGTGTWTRREEAYRQIVKGNNRQVFKENGRQIVKQNGRQVVLKMSVW